MKRLVLFIALLVTFAMSSSFAQVAHRVLEEEFTNTGCPPCAATDPFVEEFENTTMDGICVLKWHTQGPDPSDPYYIADPNEANPRSNYYGVTGVPSMQMDGSGNLFPSSVALITDLYNSALSVLPTSPFDLSVTQELTADSIIAVVTVKAVGDVPADKDLHLACVFSERYHKFTGNNGRTYYTFIVHKTLPGISQSTGAITATTNYPILSMSKGDSKTFRYASKLGTTWLANQLATVTFIQSTASKQVFQSNWTIPNVKIETPASSFITVPADAPLTYKLTNKTESPITLKATYSGPGIPAAWNVATSGIGADSSVTIPANSSASVSVTSTAASNQNGYKPFSITFTLPDKFYMGVVNGAGWGKDNQHIIVDAGASTLKCNTLSTALNAARADYKNKTVVVPRADFEALFSDWAPFHTIIYNSAATVGLYSDVGSWEKLTPYLGQGGHFLLSSTVAVTAYNNSTNDADHQLFRDNFHIEPTFYDATTPWTNLVGIDNDPIGKGINTTVAGMSTTQALTPLDAEGIPCFQDENQNNIGMHYKNESNGKSVMLTFDLEAVKAADRNSVVKRVMDWFDGVSSVKTSNEASAMKISNYPNPVSKSTKFDYSLTERGLVNLAIYDVMGREISRIVSNETEDAGTYTADYDASHLSNGSYTYVLTTGSNRVVGTMTVTK
jgi:hypothetical protein